LEILLEQASKDHAVLAWTDDDWRRVEGIRERYVNGRSLEMSSVPDNAEWESVVSLVRSAMYNLDEAIERCNFSAQFFWSAMGGDPDQPNLRRESLRTLVRALTDRLNRANAMQADIVAKSTITVGDAWRLFVSRLDGQWHAKGLKATVRKGEGPPSAFVRWIALLTDPMPRDLQQHMHGVTNESFGALSQAVWEALRLGRSQRHPGEAIARHAE
jgi:hypothetical protein